MGFDKADYGGQRHGDEGEIVNLPRLSIRRGGLAARQKPSNPC